MGHGEVAIAPAAVTAVTTGMRTEDEAAEEDDRDDEDDACDDADPGGDCGESAVASRLGHDGRWCFGWRRGGGHPTGRRFRRRRCFAHDFEDASHVDVSVLN
jgi:hypothetical protein